MSDVAVGRCSGPSRPAQFQPLVECRTRLGRPLEHLDGALVVVEATGQGKRRLLVFWLPVVGPLFLRCDVNLIVPDSVLHVAWSLPTAKVVTAPVGLAADERKAREASSLHSQWQEAEFEDSWIEVLLCRCRSGPTARPNMINGEELQPSGPPDNHDGLRCPPASRRIGGLAGPPEPDCPPKPLFTRGEPVRSCVIFAPLT